MENISKQLDKMKKYFDAVTLSADKAERSVAKFKRSAAGVDFSSPSLSTAFDYSKFDAFLNILSRVGTAVANAATKGIDFGQSMADLSAITGITGDELSRLEENARRVGTESGMGVQAAAQAYTTLASQVNVSRIGIEGLNNLQEKSVTLAQATGSSLDAAANTLAGTINQFGLSAEEAGRVINVLAAGSKFGSANVGELSQSFNAIGATAGTMGMSIESAAGALEVLSQANLKGSEAGTALREIMQALNAELGIDLSETSLSTALEALQPQLENTTLLSSLFGAGNLAAAQYLIQNAASVGQMTEMLTGSNVAQEQAAVRTETTARKLAELRAGIDNIKVGIVDSLGGLAAYATLMVENAAAIGGFISIGKKFIPMLATMGTSIKTMASSISLQTVAAKAASAATKVWSGIQMVFNAIITANPLGIIITAIGVLVAGVVACYQKFDGFRSLCDKVWETLKKVGQKIAEVWGKMKAFFGMGNDADVSITTDSSLETQTRKDTEAIKDKSAALSDMDRRLQRLNDSAGGTGVASSLEPKPVEGSVASLEQQLQKLQSVQAYASQAAAEAMQPEIEALEKKLELLKANIRTAGHDPQPANVSRNKDDLADARNHFAGMGAKRDIPLKIDLPTDGINTYAQSLEEAKQKQTEMQENMSAMGGMFGSLGEAIGGTAGQWLQYGASVLTAITQAIPALLTMLGLSAQETAAAQTETAAHVSNASAKAVEAHAGIPFVGIAMGIAAVAAIIATMASIPKYANGGIAYGPTLGVFGEYAGASSNPEVVAPLNRLKSLINPAGSGMGDGKVVFRIEGRTLKGVLERENKLNYRS